MDFVKIRAKPGTQNRPAEVYGDFQVVHSQDLMIRGKSFYAIWDEKKGLWSTDESDVQRLVDEELYAYRDNRYGQDDDVHVRTLKDWSTGAWLQYRNMVKNMYDTYHQLDATVTFLNDDVKKKDYVSKRLPYPIEDKPCEAWEELVSTLYDSSQKQKLEWAIGAVVAGAAKHIQKFLVLYGESGTGKSTILNIIQLLFPGYYSTFESKALGSANNVFATEAFRSNPLIAIEHDGDLSRIEDNTKLNSLVAHEEMSMHEKFKSVYMARPQSFLFMGTNKPVRITDGKSGIIRRLIDVRPTGEKHPVHVYNNLMSRIPFELGAIAHKCKEVYLALGPTAYDNYKPIDMIMQTDVSYNFVESQYYNFVQDDQVTLVRAWEMYKEYCNDALIEHRLPRHKFREELRNYFEEFYDRIQLDGKQLRNLYMKFRAGKFHYDDSMDKKPAPLLLLESTTSLLDQEAKDCPAQYAGDAPYLLPTKKWADVTTTLADIDTKLLHFVQLPKNHIVIDFDMTDDEGAKSADKNLVEAAKWPPTYGEFSKSGSGVHLHYYYDGDPDMLLPLYSEGIEVKVFNGNASLRRKLSLCNELPIAHISSGLPLKGEKKVINEKEVKSEQALRSLITKNLSKEILPGTKPSIDFIKKILDDAYASGLKYDVTSLRQKILLFAMQSTNNAEYCVKLVSQMQFKSKDIDTKVEEEEETNPSEYKDERIVFYDVEVFKNLFIVCWKFMGEEYPVVKMVNPSPADVGDLFGYKLVGFNNRRYDNHILYGRFLGYDNLQLFDLSSKIVGKGRNGYFASAYNLSYTDIYDFTSLKQSLKQYQVDLGIHHKELGHPWDEPIPEDKWDEAVVYCANDVISTEAVFNARKQDFVARQILAELSGLTLNHTTQAHTAKIMFGKDPRPQDKFIYTDLSELFPGYKFDAGKSEYRGEDPGEGGYVYTEPGMYENVALLDVASMHPASILAMNMFGPYTARYKELLDARLAIKHKDYDVARGLLGGLLAKYLDDPTQADALAYALKIHALNIVYGLTSASFDNKFRDPRNIDNIVAKRGALFMIDLKHAVQEQGFTVAHIKTDSIKIPNATPEIIDFVMEFGKKYGYTFEHEKTFTKLCLVNKAVYIAQFINKKGKPEWTATGAQFAHPYVFKSLFSKEPIEFADLCENKAVSSPALIYLDMNEGMEEGEHNYLFVGRVGSFCPVVEGSGGGLLMRKDEDRYTAVTGSKGYRWVEAEVLNELDKTDRIDTNYHEGLVTDAIEHISKFGDFKAFVSE